MAIDLSKFLGQYFSESHASLGEIESFLANWPDVGALSKAARAAHSIKGNSGAFGFDEVAKLAAALEDAFRLLDLHVADPTPVRLDSCRAVLTLLGEALRVRQGGDVVVDVRIAAVVDELEKAFASGANRCS